MISRLVLSKDQKTESQFTCVEKELTFKELAEQLHQEMVQKIEANKLSNQKE